MLDPVVLDASAWLSVLLEEEGAHRIESILRDRALYSPELIRYETANAILTACRSGRSIFKKISFREFFEIISEFPIKIVPVETWWKKSMEIVENYDITFYDATYIGIASVLRIPLLTMDKNIMKITASEKLDLVFEHGK